MKTTLLLLAGVAAGVCIGLLVAPDKGSETRKKVAEATSDWADKFMNMMSRSTDNGRIRKEFSSPSRTPSVG